MANASTTINWFSSLATPLSDDAEDVLPNYSLSIVSLRSSLVIVSSILSLVSNILCIIILKSRKCNIPENNRLLMITVSLSDFGIAVVTVITIAPVILNRWPYGRTMCMIQSLLSQFLSGTSIFLLLAVSIDRYIAISKPLRYPVLVTRRRILLTVSAIWFIESLLCFGLVPVAGAPIRYSIVVGRCTPIWRPGHDTAMLLGGLTTTIIVPFIVMIFIYTRLFLITRKQLATLQKMSRASGHNPPWMIASTHNDRKTSRIFFSITIVFALSWFPYTIVTFYQNLAETYAPDMIQFLAMFTTYSSSWLDVLTFAILSRSFRNASRLLLINVCPRCLLTNNSIFSLSSMVDNTSKDTFDCHQP